MREAIPQCLREAYRFLHDDRAWVACLAGDAGVITLASNARKEELACDPVFAPYLDPDCPKDERAGILLGGIKELEEELI